MDFEEFLIGLKFLGQRETFPFELDEGGGKSSIRDVVLEALADDEAESVIKSHQTSVEGGVV